jgi:hypothetical protein
MIELRILNEAALVEWRELRLQSGRSPGLHLHIGRRCVYITSSDTHPKSGPSSSVTRGSTKAGAAAAFLKLISRIANMSSSISASAASGSSTASTHLRPSVPAPATRAATPRARPAGWTWARARAASPPSARRGARRPCARRSRRGGGTGGCGSATGGARARTCCARIGRRPRGGGESPDRGPPCRPRGAAQPPPGARTGTRSSRGSARERSAAP